MTIKDAITQEMTRLSKEGVVFVGYNLVCGHKGFGTLAQVPREQIIETPVNEGMMLGMAVGLALQGKKVMVIFERHDFLLGALDQLVNHLDKMFVDLPVAIRAIVGTTKPLNAGVQHTMDYTDALKRMLKNTVVEEDTLSYVWDSPRLFVEHKENYGKEVNA